MAYGLDFNRMAPAYQRRPGMSGDAGGYRDIVYDPAAMAKQGMGQQVNPWQQPIAPQRPWQQRPAYTPRGGMSPRGSRIRPAYDYMPPNAF